MEIGKLPRGSATAIVSGSMRGSENENAFPCRHWTRCWGWSRMVVGWLVVEHLGAEWFLTARVAEEVVLSPEVHSRYGPAKA